MRDHILQVIEDLLTNVFRNLGCETVPSEYILDVPGVLLLEAWFVKLLANKRACLPLIETELDLG